MYLTKYKMNTATNLTISNQSNSYADHELESLVILSHYTQCNLTAKWKYSRQGKLQIIIMIDLGVAETTIAEIIWT